MAIVTQESVFTAADALAAKGVTVTQNAIRSELGGGSYSTIGGFLNQWREQRTPAQTPAAPADPAPDGLRERLEGLLAAAWSEANNAANARLEAAQASLEASRAASEREKADAVAFADAASADLDAARATIAQLTADAEARAKEHAAQIAAGAAQVDQLRQQLAQLEGDHRAALAAKSELAQVLDTTRGELRTTQADVARLTGEVKAAQAREAAETRIAAAADKRATQAQAKADKAGEQLASVRADLEGAREQAKSAQTEVGKVRAEAIAARQAERDAFTRATTLQLQLDALTKHAKASKASS